MGTQLGVANAPWIRPIDLVDLTAVLLIRVDVLSRRHRHLDEAHPAAQLGVVAQQASKASSRRGMPFV